LKQTITRIKLIAPDISLFTKTSLPLHLRTG
jgi:hypothetical protein